jgi:hypothetical protein
MGVDLTLHTDGMNNAYVQLAFVNPQGFLTWAKAVLAGQPLAPTDTVEWWNELSSLPDSDWTPLTTLYSTLGNWMNDAIAATGAVAVCPMPMSQTPRGVYDAFNGMLNPQLFRGRQRYAAHLYKEDLPVGMALDAALDQQFAWLDAANTFLDGAPFEINEFGGSVPGPSLVASQPGPPVPDMAFNEGVVSRCVARGWRYSAWQWIGPGTGLEVHQFPELISLLVGKPAIPTAT